MTEEITFTVADYVGEIMLNRPQKHNAMTPKMAAELQAICAAIDRDDTVRVVMLRGAGEADSSADASAAATCCSWAKAGGASRPAVPAVNAAARSSLGRVIGSNTVIIFLSFPALAVSPLERGSGGRIQKWKIAPRYGPCCTTS